MLPARADLGCQKVNPILHHGAAFYPELWPQAIVDEDIAGMKRLGLTVARMGEFAWAQMEPEEGRIDLSYFVDTWSRVDSPPVSELRRTEDKKLLMQLERGNNEELVRAGWN